jgi:hypothetical protein
MLHDLNYSCVSLAQIRTREVPSQTDPWWPVRGKRIVDTASDPEGERFWNAVDSRTQNNTFNQRPTA